MNPDNTPLDKLFPPPSSPPSRISPVTLPGNVPDAVKDLQEVLKDNHVKWDIFFNDKRYHNHAAHRALALWSIGAAGDVIKAGYKKDTKYERPARKSPEDITMENFYEHLGDDKYYDAYLKFFTAVVQKEGTAASLEKFLFSKKANVDHHGHNRGKEHPQMFARFLSGLLHPLIHTGYGVEFALPGMIIEGLAQTAVHHATVEKLIPLNSFDTLPNVSEFVGGVISRFTSHLSLNTILPASVVPAGTHAFTVLSRILNDKRFDDIEKTDETFKDVVSKHGDAILEYANQWTLNTLDPKAVEEKIEELVWSNVLIYGLGGWKEDKDFNADFFQMHLVTSSLFLSSLVAYLTPASQAILLRGYFVVSLAWWISRGRPGFSIPQFFRNSDMAYPVPPGRKPEPDDSALLPPSSTKAVTPNSWMPILETAMIHPDDHIAKLQRALAHYARLYGERTPGMPDFVETELEDASKLDGSLFLRVAGLTAKRMGRVRNGEKPAVFWDREGFYKSKGSKM